MTDQNLPAGLEDRVVAALRAEGALAPAFRQWPMRRLAGVAAVLLVATAWGAFVVGRSSAGSAGPGDKYLLLLYGAQTAGPAEEASRVEEYSVWAGRLASERRLDAAERLGDAASVAGPALAGLAAAPPPLGFFVIRALTFDDAVAVAARSPHAKHGGTVVVRRIE